MELSLEFTMLKKQNPFFFSGRRKTQRGYLMTGVDWLTAAASGVFGSGLMAIYAKRVIKSLIVTDAETDIVKQLHNEINRLSKQNTELAGLVRDLQLEVIAMRKENGLLIVRLQGLERRKVERNGSR